MAAHSSPMKSLLRAIAHLGSAQIVTLLLGMVATKILAVTLGAAGTGLYSLIRQLHDLAVGAAAMGSGTALVQGLSARDGEARGRLLGTGMLLCILGVAVSAAILLVFPGTIAGALFDRDGPAERAVVGLMAGTVVVGVAGSFVAGLVQARHGFGQFALAQIASSAALAALAYPVAQAALAEPAALLILVAVPIGVQIAVMVWLSRRLGVGGDIAAARPQWEAGAGRHFLGFVAFGVVQLVLAAGSGLLIRALIVHAHGLEAAGHFQAAWTLGMQNLTLLLAPFAAYVVPTLAATRDNVPAHRAAWNDIATVILAASVPMVVAAIVFKPLLLRIFYAEAFVEAVPVLQWMLLANLAKAASWVLAVPFLAAARLRPYLVLETAWHIVFVAGAWAAVDGLGDLQYVGAAFLAGYIFYLALAWAFCRRYFGLAFAARLNAMMSVGALLALASALLTWNETHVDWPLAVAACLCAGLVAVAALNSSRRAKLWRLIGAAGRGRWTGS